MSEAVIRIRFNSYWIAGGGIAAAGVDVATWRDEDDCPAMPMTQIKGQLRETAARLFGVDSDEIAALFGSAYGAGRDGIPEISPLSFRGEARIPVPARARFREDAAARAALFRQIASTRINDRGVADDRTLRRFEAAIPLVLEGRITPRGSSTLPTDWIGTLDRVAGCTLAFGKSKADGFGRAVASVEEQR